MRLHTLLIILTVMGIMSISVLDYLSYIRTLGQKEHSLFITYSGKRFIAESFRQTCKGRGFDNLEQWQLTCRRLFKLEYIAWCSSDDFMIDEAGENNSCLMYGKWIAGEEYSDMSGEVYCRKSEAIKTEEGF